MGGFPIINDTDYEKKFKFNNIVIKKEYSA